MGSNLLLTAVEIERDKQPDWDAAIKHVESLSDEDCARAVAEVEHGDDLEGVELSDYFDSAGQEVRNAVDWCINGWNGHLRGMIKICLAATDMLIAGDMADDKTEEMKHVELFIVSGAAEAAGFLTHDAFHDRVACWFNRAEAQQLVDRHAAYTEAGIKRQHEDLDEMEGEILVRSDPCPGRPGNHSQGPGSDQ